MALKDSMQVSWDRPRAVFRMAMAIGMAIVIWIVWPFC